MRLLHLSLSHFRNYTRLELPIPAGLTIIQGANAQGKSNLLEAIVYLATSRSPRTSSDSELINWLAQEEPYPYMRLAAEISHNDHQDQLDITLMPGKNNGRLRKQVRLNGVNKRAMDIIGRLLVVLFQPEDVALVAGSPSVRRRYLDVCLCQIAPAYCRALNEYNKALAQRNALLRNLSARGRSAGEQLRFWDEKIAGTGSLVIVRRQWLINQLQAEASLRHLDLSGGYERLQIRYLPSFDPDHIPTRQAPAYSSTRQLRERGVSYAQLDIERVRTSYLAHLQVGRRRELEAGMTLIGPHRDDFGFYLGTRNLRIYGSRGQQRTAALASKLAEITIMTRESGSSPLLLLDDVMSELDVDRRAMLVELLQSAPQAIVTTTDWAPFDTPLLAGAHRLHVHQGQIRQWENDQVSNEANLS